MELGLDASATFALPGPVFPSGAYVAVVKNGALSPDADHVAGAVSTESPAPGVRIVRDKWGIPHIFATGPNEQAIEENIGFGVGYAQAEERMFQMEVLRRAEWQTINALVEEATRVGAQEEDARNWWRLEPLNRTFLDSFPDKAKQLIAGRTDSATLALSDSDKWAPWQPGWRAAITAARSRGFIAGSGVPSLAATVISRANLPNSLDFWASCRPLRCMMFLNWECPAMRSLFRIRPGCEGWKARRYRPGTRQNQRFGAHSGTPVVPHAGI